MNWISELSTLLHDYLWETILTATTLALIIGCHLKLIVRVRRRPLKTAITTMPAS